jgi:hypothetical protein
LDITSGAPDDSERFDAGIRAHQSHAARIVNARQFAVLALAAAAVLAIAAAFVAWSSR